MGIDQIATTFGIDVILLAAFLPILKKVINGAIEGSISNSFEKNLEKYKAELSRASAAQDLILKREMEFYEATDKYLAELIPQIQDMNDAAQERKFGQFEKNCFTSYMEVIPKMKDLRLRYEPYVEEKTLNAFGAVVIQMQSDAEFWYNVAELLSSDKKINEVDLQEATNKCDALLMSIALARSNQAKYLKEIAKM